MIGYDYYYYYTVLVDTVEMLSDDERCRRNNHSGQFIDYDKFSRHSIQISCSKLLEYLIRNSNSVLNSSCAVIIMLI